jgi:hypothetical protein
LQENHYLKLRRNSRGLAGSGLQVALRHVEVSVPINRLVISIIIVGLIIIRSGG